MNATPQKAKEIFVAALKLAPDQWDGYLAEACGGDDELRSRVRDLLQANAEAGSFLESPASDPVATVDGPIREGPGTIIGSYKLLEQIGEGGFGVVFMAEQTQPVRRRVALKVLKPGMDTRQVVARFEAERQALAIMDHPNIAKVHDGGATASGRPYFVMELVKGMPMTDFCDQHHLTPRQRLELFIPVCQAVQHAHHKGIIHRDLKPSNVLVTVHDTTPVVKVIDFGVAKALGQELTDKTLFTGLAQMVGTPLYMSPEQAGQSGLDIDTRSDIYSLGVLLYELLTGTTPFEKERFKQAAYDEIRRIIREEEPPRPSTRLSDSKDSLASISAQRHMEPAKLTKLVRGELDWIVMKALEKGRNRRYETANGLAGDIEHYLRDEPVSACPPSAWYRFRKFAGRNKVALAMCAVVSAALVLTVVILALSNLRIQDEKEQKETALQQAQANGERAQENLRLALTALDGIYLQVSEERLPRDPQRKKEDTEVLKKALDFYQRFAEQNRADTITRLEVIRAYRRTGDIQEFIGGHKAAQQAYLFALDRAKELATEYPSEAGYLYELAVCHNCAGEAVGAVDHFQEAIKLLTKLKADYPAVAEYRAEWARSHHGIGRLHKQKGERGAAERSFRQALEVQTRLAADFPGVAQYRSDLAEMYRNLGYWMEGGRAQGHPADVAHVRRACEILTKLVADFPELPRYRQRLASSLQQLASTGAPWEGTIENQVIGLLTKLTADFPQVPRYRQELALCYCNFGEGHRMGGAWDKAATYWRKSLDLDAKLATENGQKLGLTANVGNWAEILIYRGELVEARKLLEDAFGQPHADTGTSIVIANYLLAGIVAAGGDGAEAAKRRKDADQCLVETSRKVQALRGDARAAAFCDGIAVELGYIAVAWKKCRNRQGLATAQEAAIKATGEAAALDPKNAGLHLRQADLYVQLGRKDKATRALERARAAWEKAMESHPPQHDAWYGYAELCLFLGNEDAYRRNRKALLERFGKTNDPVIAERTSRACLLLPVAGEELQQAVALADRAIELGQNHEYYPFFMAAKALAEFRLGRFESAIDWGQKAGARGVWAPTHLLLAMAHQRLGHTEQAFQSLANALKTYDWNKRDGIIHALRREAEALIVIDLDPRNAGAWNARGSYYAHLKQWDKAIADYTKVIGLSPKNAWGLGQRALCYAELKQWDRAIADFTRAIDVDRTNAKIWGEQLLKEWDKAIAHSPTAIELDPKTASAWHKWASSYHATLKQWDKAIAHCAKTIALDPKNAPAWRERASYYANLKQWDKAIADYTEVIRLDPKNAQGWHQRAHGHERLQQWDLAFADFSKAIELSPKEASHLYCRGRCYFNVGQHDKAIADCTKAIGLDPKNASMHNDLAWQLATDANPKAPDRGRAVNCAKKAVELAPKKGNYWNTLGVAHYRAGDWQAALKALEKSMEFRKGGDSVSCPGRISAAQLDHYATLRESRTTLAWWHNGR